MNETNQGDYNNEIQNKQQSDFYQHKVEDVQPDQSQREKIQEYSSIEDVQPDLSQQEKIPEYALYSACEYLFCRRTND